MTRLEDFRFLRERGFAPMGMGLSFSTRRDLAEVFSRFRSLGFEIHDEKLRVADVFGVSEVDRPLGLFFCGHVRPSRDKGARIELHVKRKPEGTPPEDVTKISSRVGGFPAALEKFAMAWADDSRVRFKLAAEYWPTDEDLKPPFRGRELGKKLRGVRLEREELHLVPKGKFPCLRNMSVTLVDKEKEWFIVADGEVDLPLSGGLFDLADEQLWSDMRKVLK